MDAENIADYVYTEWTYEGERTGIKSQVAIDGNRSRYQAERMIVRIKGGCFLASN